MLFDAVLNGIVFLEPQKAISLLALSFTLQVDWIHCLQSSLFFRTLIPSAYSHFFACFLSIHFFFFFFASTMQWWGGMAKVVKFQINCTWATQVIGNARGLIFLILGLVTCRMAMIIITMQSCPETFRDDSVVWGLIILDMGGRKDSLTSAPLSDTSWFSL